MRITATVVKQNTDERPAHLAPHPCPGHPYVAYWLAPNGKLIITENKRTKREALDALSCLVQELMKTELWDELEDRELYL